MTLDVYGNTIPSYPPPCPHKRCKGTGYYTRYNLYDWKDREQIPCPLCNRKGFTTPAKSGYLDDVEWFFVGDYRKYLDLVYDRKMFAALSTETCDQLADALSTETCDQLADGLRMVMEEERGPELAKDSTTKIVKKLSFILCQDVWEELARKPENGDYRGGVAGVRSLFSKLILTQKAEAMA